MPRLPSWLLLIAIGTIQPALGEECDRSFEAASGDFDFVAQDPDDWQVPPGTTVGRVYVTRLPIFDESNPDENNLIFRWANRFHYLTRERTVTRDLLFEVGDEFRQPLVEESARLLRARNHLYDAAIRPVRQCDGEVDLEVVTRDLWSFTPEISFDRSGGDNSFRFGVAESNLLGTGRQISFASIEDETRDSQRFVFRDVNVGGHHIETRLQYVDSDDGSHRYGLLRLPFYSLDSKRAWRLSTDQLSRHETQYRLGDEISEIGHQVDEHIGSVGWSAGLVNGVTRRFRLGYVYREDTYFDTGVLAPPEQRPQDRVLSYPYIQYSSTEDQYTTVFNLDQIYRTEDIHVGRSVSTLLGIATGALGASADYLVARFDYSDTVYHDQRTLVQHHLSVSGYRNLEASRNEDLIASWNGRYSRSHSERRAFFARLGLTYTHNLNPAQQIFMGGLRGARAFDNRLQTGDRSIRLTAEERFYTDVHLLNLVRVGFAAFVDVGRAWTPGVDDGLPDDYLANLGVGIRLASSKADAGRIIHIDFAIPLTNRGHQKVDSFEIAINIKDTF